MRGRLRGEPTAHGSRLERDYDSPVIGGAAGCLTPWCKIAASAQGCPPGRLKDGYRREDLFENMPVTSIPYSELSMHSTLFRPFAFASYSA